MEATITASLIGAAGSIIAAAIGARLAHPAPLRDPAPDSADDDRSIPDPPDPSSGFGPLLLAALAGFLFFMGFAFVGYVVLDFITTVFAAMQSPDPVPPDLSAIPIVPLLPLGFGLSFGGLVVWALFTLVTGMHLARSRRFAGWRQ